MLKNYKMKKLKKKMYALGQEPTISHPVVGIGEVADEERDVGVVGHQMIERHCRVVRDPLGRPTQAPIR